MKDVVAKFFNDESGATAVEYALLVGLIAVGIIAAVSNLGTAISDFFGRISNRLGQIQPAGGAATTPTTPTTPTK